ncbi:MAG: hypothetical protein AB7Q29_16055 [Vicinamibacterales bacterium]
MIFRLPWVSREAYADRLREIEWLKGRLEEVDADRRHLADQLARISRRQNGLPEAPIPRREREPGDRMPPELLEYFDGMRPANIGLGLKNAAMKRRRDGDTWEQITEAFLPKEEAFNHTPDWGSEEEYDGEDP